MGFFRVVALVTQDGGLVNELYNGGVPLYQMSESYCCLKVIGPGFFPVFEILQ